MAFRIMRLLPVSLATALLMPAGVAFGETAGAIHVDGRKGDDGNSGRPGEPLKTLSAALAKVPDPLRDSVVIELAATGYSSTGARGMPADSLQLMRRMRPGVRVTIHGQDDASGGKAVLAWPGNPMVEASEGDWRLENLVVGTGDTRQRRGVLVAGPAQLTLQDVTFRTRSLSDAAIYAHRGGKVLLRGAIRINDDLHQRAEAETFAGIIADDHGLVQFAQREGASLSIGNGSLSAMYYGVIRLGCETARITCWTDQSNVLAINNSGRIDLHNTTTTLRAKKPQNTPIGLEHDGHILAEGARLIIEGANHNAIVLQKASTFTCNDIELRGSFRNTVSAMSGSLFVGGFLGDVSGVEATTGASIHIEKIEGRLLGNPTATRGAVISLPNSVTVSETGKNSGKSSGSTR